MMQRSPAIVVCLVHERAELSKSFDRRVFAYVTEIKISYKRKESQGFTSKSK
jgi:hypothetical protein